MVSSKDNTTGLLAKVARRSARPEARPTTPDEPAAAPQPRDGPADEATPDAVLGVVQYLAGLWGKPASKDAITAGLPLDRGRLTERLLAPALERVGLQVRTVRRSLRQLGEFEMPAIFVTRQGELRVCVGREPGGGLRCYNAEAGFEQVFDGAALDLRMRRTLLLVQPVYEAAAATTARARRHWLAAAFSGHWTSAFYVMLAAVFINLFAVAFPIFTLNVYDRVLPNAATATLWVLAIGLMLVLVFDTLLKLARGVIIDYVGRRIDYRLSGLLFDRVLNAPLAARPASTGAFISRVAQYEVLRDFLASSTLVLFVDVIFMGLFAYVIGVLVGWLVVFPLIAGVIAVLVTLGIGLRSGRSVEAALAEAAQRNSLLVEALTAPQTMKASRAEGEFLRRWESTVLATSATQSRIKWYQSLATNITAVTSQAAMLSIVIGGTYLFADGQISMGAIIAAMMLSNRLIAPIAQISAFLLKTRGAAEAFRTLAAIFELPDERGQAERYVNREITQGKVEFRKVRFAYPGARTHVLDGVSFTINPGEKVGIIGRIGSGKTTIGRLLVNFYTPSEGEILVDGIAIDQYHPHELRRQVGLVIQDPELFSGTVRENILLSKPTATEAELVDVARRAGVEAFVARHPLGYDRPVGEGGALLSGGQRQAIALARAMLVRPTILFLDEPSSSMDLATERQLITHLSASLAPEHTVIIATHRYSLLALVTRLLVIDGGRIVADGPRDAVLQQLKSKGEPT
ncbi:type I secretion system permease/ATPase [Devosia sp.]|uniref:type I secretion system permease/ATPase n=1 Tax=Devosia sp. TaxID=1871048 RepID=UPI002F121A12